MSGSLNNFLEPESAHFHHENVIYQLQSRQSVIHYPIGGQYPVPAPVPAEVPDVEVCYASMRTEITKTSGSAVAAFQPGSSNVDDEVAGPVVSLVQ